MFGSVQQKMECLPSVNDVEGKNHNLDMDMEDFGSNKENLQRSGARTVVKTYQINRASVDSLNVQEKKAFSASEQADHRGRILTESHHQNGATDKNERKCKDYGDCCSFCPLDLLTMLLWCRQVLMMLFKVQFPYTIKTTEAQRGSILMLPNPKGNLGM